MMSILDDVDILTVLYESVLPCTITHFFSKQQLKHERRWQIDIQIKYSQIKNIQTIKEKFLPRKLHLNEHS